MKTPRPCLFLFLVVLCAWGCNAPQEVSVDETAQRLKSLRGAYHAFTTENSRAPRGAAELRAFIAKKSLGNADTLLTSPRDGQPFVVVWGFDVRRRNAGNEGGYDKMSSDKAGAIFAYERLGRDGQRYALFTHGGTLLMPEDQFRQALFFGGHRPD